MAKAKTAYVCADCGAEHSKWQGQCVECGAWNTLSQFVVQLPCDLNGSRPIVEIGQRSIPITG